MAGDRGRRGWHRLDSRWIARLIGAAGIGPGDLVVDVGAGDGRITAQLLDHGASVIAVELHAGRAAALRTRFQERDVIVVRADASDLRLPRRPLKVVANPPFGITTAESEKAVFALIEQIAIDANDCGDEFWDPLLEHWDNGQLLELASVITTFLNIGRRGDTLGVSDPSLFSQPVG